MRLLLDTHLLLWALTEPDRIDPECRAAIEDTRNDVFFSTASIWEIAIKASLRRPDFPFHSSKIMQEACDTGFNELAIRGRAVCHIGELPQHHRDPFDRLLVAQAITEPLLLYTADPKLLLYSDLVRLVS